MLAPDPAGAPAAARAVPAVSPVLCCAVLCCVRFVAGAGQAVEELVMKVMGGNLAQLVPVPGVTHAQPPQGHGLPQAGPAGHRGPAHPAHAMQPHAQTQQQHHHHPLHQHQQIGSAGGAGGAAAGLQHQAAGGPRGPLPPQQQQQQSSSMHGMPQQLVQLPVQQQQQLAQQQSLAGLFGGGGNIAQAPGGMQLTPQQHQLLLQRQQQQMLQGQQFVPGPQQFMALQAQRSQGMGPQEQ